MEGNKQLQLHVDSVARIKELLRGTDKESDDIIANTIENQ